LTRPIEKITITASPVRMKGDEAFADLLPGWPRVGSLFFWPKSKAFEIIPEDFKKGGANGIN
jgi:hypothetical protein